MHEPSKRKLKHHRPRHSRPIQLSSSSSTPTDLMSRLIQSLSNTTYECMICYERIKAKDKVWSCLCCWAVFHLTCIHTWSQSKTSQESLFTTTWRCPGCQTESTQPPTDYSCFCGKVTDPPLNRFFTPHSCGQTCQRPRPDCPHTCNELCHPGPCPPCKSYAPITSCYCGKQRLSHRCADKEYSKSCKKECGLMLNCGLHTCQKQCHPPPCSPCCISVQETCFCGQSSRTVSCGTNEPFSCQYPCPHVYSCGHHQCELLCHPQPHSDTCPFDPLVIHSCPCGKTPVIQLLGHPRQSCTDPIPCCHLPCDTLLPCGHTCSQPCHTGPCLPCPKTQLVTCRGGHQTYHKPCASLVQHVYCDTKCTSRLDCRKHVCDTLCCDKVVHECHQLCNKLLKCQLHHCLDHCGHRGPCHDCVEGVVFDEVTCHCGRTVMYPPIPCNTPPPICHYPCTRRLPCHHTPTPHPCHPDDVPCPPCMYFVQRPCVCGKTIMNNVPCSRQGRTTCPLPCDKVIPTCLHHCKRFCHTGDCVTQEDVCQEKCHHIRSCGHVCEYKCHGDTTCLEQQPCRARVVFHCPCKRRKVQTVCNQSKEKPGCKMMQVTCDDVCALEERNRRLAEAFGMDPTVLPNHTDKLLSTLPAALVSFAQQQPRMCQQLESILVQFLSDSSKKVYHFPQHKPSMNHVISHLAKDYYGLNADIVDAERGKGSVVCRKKLEATPLPHEPLYVLAKEYTASVSTPTPPSSSTLTHKRYPAIHIQHITCPMDAQDMKILVEPLFHPHCDILVKWVVQENQEDCFIIMTETRMEGQEFKEWIAIKVDELKLKMCDTNGWAESVCSCQVDGQGILIETHSKETEESIPIQQSSMTTHSTDFKVPQVDTRFALLDIE